MKKTMAILCLCSIDLSACSSFEKSENLLERNVASENIKRLPEKIKITCGEQDLDKYYKERVIAWTEVVVQGLGIRFKDEELRGYYSAKNGGFGYKVNFSAKEKKLFSNEPMNGFMSCYGLNNKEISNELVCDPIEGSPFSQFENGKYDVKIKFSFDKTLPNNMQISGGSISERIMDEHAFYNYSRELMCSVVEIQ